MIDRGVTKHRAGPIYIYIHGRKNWRDVCGLNIKRIIIGSDRRPETKQGIEGKIDRFRSGRVRVRDRVRVRFRSPIWTYQFWRLLTDRRCEPNTVHIETGVERLVLFSVLHLHLVQVIAT